MDTHNHNNSLDQTKAEEFKNKILQKIKTGNISMRPKAYFVVGMIALICLAFLVTVTTILLISYTLFGLVVSGHLLLLGFGWRGVEAFILLFPWFTFGLDILLLLGFGWLVRKFRFGYHRPIMFLFFGTTVVLVCLGYIVSVTSFHGTLLHHAERQELPGMMGPIVGPVVQPLYDHLRMSHHDTGVIQGTVTSITGNTFTISHDDYDADIDDATTTVIAPAGTDINTFLKVGDHVLVGGDILPSGQVQAYGVTKFQAQ